MEVNCRACAQCTYYFRFHKSLSPILFLCADLSE